MTSAEVCGPRPGGYTVSNKRFRRAENVVLIDRTSTGLKRELFTYGYLLIMVATVLSTTKCKPDWIWYRRSQRWATPPL
jgi:hypothetical protein